MDRHVLNLIHGQTFINLIHGQTWNLNRKIGHVVHCILEDHPTDRKIGHVYMCVHTPNKNYPLLMPLKISDYQLITKKGTQKQVPALGKTL